MSLRIMTSYSDSPSTVRGNWEIATSGLMCTTSIPPWVSASIRGCPQTWVEKPFTSTLNGEATNTGPIFAAASPAYSILIFCAPCLHSAFEPKFAVAAELVQGELDERIEIVSIWMMLAAGSLPGANGLVEPPELFVDTTQKVGRFGVAAGSGPADSLVLRIVQRQGIVAGGLLKTVPFEVTCGSPHERRDVDPVKALVHLERNEVLSRQDLQGLFVHPEFDHHRQHPLAHVLAERVELAHCRAPIHPLLGEILLAIE